MRSSAFRISIVEIDILKGESRTPEFLAMNPSGHVPLLEVAPGRYLAESNAILWYIAGGTPLAPEDRIERAEALQWMFFEQHSLEPNLGAAYFWLALVKGGRELQSHALEDWMENGYRALGVMEKHLTTQRLLRRRAFHHRRHRALRLHAPGATQCDYDLTGFPAIRAWLDRDRRPARLRADGLAAAGPGRGAVGPVIPERAEGANPKSILHRTRTAGALAKSLPGSTRQSMRQRKLHISTEQRVATHHGCPGQARA